MEFGCACRINLVHSFLFFRGFNFWNPLVLLFMSFTKMLDLQINNIAWHVAVSYVLAFARFGENAIILALA